jgi:ABC-type glycerol-3-phosphate transport system substrate-binding protein
MIRRSGTACRRATALGAVITAAALALTACSSGGGNSKAAPPPATGSDLKGNLDVRVYGDWPFVKANAATFMQAHPDVKITVGGTTNDELRQAGGRIFTSSDSPDVVSFTYNYPVIEDWVKAGALLNLDDMWTDSLKKVLPQSVIDQSKASDGHYYAYPLGLTILPTVFYNKPALQSAGITVNNRQFGSMDQFEQDLATLQKKGFDQPMSSPGQSLVELLWFGALSSSCGPDTYSKLVHNWKDASAPKYTDACAVRAIDTLKRWGSAGYLPKGWAQVTYDQSTALFQKNSAMWVSGDWAPPVYTPKFPWDWAALPAVAGGQPTPMGLGVDSFLVPAKAKNPAVAKAFIEYMTSPSVLEQKMGRVPARTDVDLQKVIGDNPVEISIAKEVSNFKQVPYFGISVPPSVLEAVVQNVAGGAVAGRMSSEDAAKAVQKAADDYRAQNG